MDQLGKRLRKQRERSSLHARQLNKNAASMLHRQLHALERREEQNARNLMRKRLALLQELSDVEEPEHEGSRKVADSPTYRRPAPIPSIPRDSVGSSSPRAAYTHREHSPEHCAATCTRESNSSPVTGPPRDCSGHPDLSSSFRRHYGAYAGANNQSGEICRFRALSPLNPCPYFPCSRPQSYHHLRVSDIPDPLHMHREKNLLTSLHSASSPTLEDAHGSDLSPRRSASAHRPDGHASTRTSINERLRGLRQLVRELRYKNEEKRPRDWAVNYGDPMCKRLLRKPVVPVSDEQVTQ